MRINLRALALVLVVLVGCPHVARAETAAPKLVICGGGSLPDSIYKRFRALAGAQPKLVYVPTASQRKVDEPSLRDLWRSRGFDDLTVLHSNDRAITSSEDFAKPLESATAVWFGGGSQQRIADAYLGTPVEVALRAVLDRGGVIGGSSAGAAIQSRVMIASGGREPKISKGMDLLSNAIVDQHFLQRNRIARLTSAVKQYPDRVGFGIDESTAIIVIGDQAEVIGRSYVIRIESTNDQIQIDSFGSGETLPLTK